MTRLIRIEVLKLRTARLTYGLLATAAGLTAFDALLRAARAGNRNIPPLYTERGQATILTVVGFALLMALVLGVTVSSGEFRHKTATLTYLATPERSAVLVAKLVAGLIGGLAFAAVGFAVTAAVARTFVAADGDHVVLSTGTIVRDAGGTLLGGALLSSAGVGLGTLVRAQLGAVVGVLVWGFLVESILSGVFDSIGPYLPFTAAVTMAGARLGSGGFGFAGPSSASPLPFLAATALVAAVAAVISVIASRTALRADIT